MSRKLAGHQNKSIAPQPSVSLSRPGILNRQYESGNTPELYGKTAPSESSSRASIGYSFGQMAVDVPRSPAVQAKLTIGQPSDRYEKESDLVADQVMRIPDPALTKELQVQRSPLAGYSFGNPEIEPKKQFRVHKQPQLQQHPATETPSTLNSNGTGGKKPGGQYREDEIIGGRTVGEFIGDVARPVGTGLGNVVGSVAGALTGISISSNSLVGPTWNNHGHFDWGVMFNTTGRSGWIVQEIVNTYRAEDNAGNNLPHAVTPHYWEAWSVDAAGAIDPNFVDARGCDDWIRPNRGNNTRGHWSMTGKVYFTQTDPATQGFTPGGAANAGGLLSTTANPGGLGVARLHRYAQGTWDSTGITPTHTGSAGP